MIRPRRWDYFLEIAQVTAKRATCPRLSVGAVLVNQNYHILSTGYNGAPRGAPHCHSAGCSVNDDFHCTRAVHAEANALIQAAFNGIRTKNTILFCTHAPCYMCMKLIVNAGVKAVIYREEYKLSPAALELAAVCEVALHQWELK